ncbi:translation initiation factor IF-2-like [Schistocerca gregaria]|uniref:translation initiation factor IF-2-like n=1 Tax=Schistocerca gregaria TaxID=7010 RepID=UPI00211EFAC1|nr:translation initiation factor IF-2-like [Schistocerca gregaria]
MPECRSGLRATCCVIAPRRRPTCCEAPLLGRDRRPASTELAAPPWPRNNCAPTRPFRCERAAVRMRGTPHVAAAPAASGQGPPPSPTPQRAAWAATLHSARMPRGRRRAPPQKRPPRRLLTSPAPRGAASALPPLTGAALPLAGRDARPASVTAF